MSSHRHFGLNRRPPERPFIAGETWFYGIVLGFYALMFCSVLYGLHLLAKFLAR